MIKTIEQTSFLKNLENHVMQLSEKDPAWNKPLRKLGLERFNTLGVPTVRDEEWKYTNLSALTQNTFSLALSPSISPKEKLAKYVTKDDINIIFVDGTFNKDLSNIRSIQGLMITDLNKSSADKDFESLAKKYDPKQETAFQGLNRALASDGFYIHVAKNAHIQELIHIVHVHTSGSKEHAIHPRTYISMELSSEASVLESHVSFSNDVLYFSNALTDIHISENATLHYCKAQSDSIKAVHIGNTRIWQERNSNLDGFSLMVGGQITRNNLDIVLNGEGANAILNGLYCANGSQLVDNHSSVDHQQPNCTSNQYYKGILNGSSRGIFNGKIFVKPIAQKTNSYQLNKNLLLGRDALVNTKPQLEIFADDVKCTHGATIGQLNEDEVFYLQTRCIKKSDAVKMLSKAFIDDIINTVSNPLIREKLMVLLEPTLSEL